MENKVLQATILGAKKGNKEDFVALCTEKGRAILYLCYRELKNWQDAEDAAQEVMLRMYRKLDGLESAAAFNVWLYRIVLSTCRDVHRKNKRHKNMVDMDDMRETLADDSMVSLPQAYLEDKDTRERVVGFVDELPEKYRQCILLHYFENLSYQEIASVMGIRAVTVDSYLRMGRKLLRDRLERDGHRAKGGGQGKLNAVALGPMLAGVLKVSAESTVPAGAVEACVRAAQAGVVRAAIAKKVALAGAGVAAVVAAVVFLFSLAKPPAPGGLAVAGQPSLPQGDAVVSAPAGTEGAPPPGAVADAPKGSLEGRVFVETPGPQGTPVRRGVAGVVLELVSEANPQEVLLKATTGPDGTFRFSGIAVADYRVLATLPDGAAAADGAAYLPETAQSGWMVQGEGPKIAVAPGETTPALELCLTLPVFLSGTVETVNPAGCEVFLLSPDGEELASTLAQPDGSYVFDELYLPCEGEYTLRVNDGGMVYTVTVYLYPGYGLGYVEGP